jgi:indole-3-glycerol phosphate synthase
MDVAGVETLLRRIPAGIVAVAESGLRARSDVDLVAWWGADAVLVGTALAAADDPAASVRALTGVTRTGRP